MQRRSARTLFLVVVTCAALFVWITRQALPEVAASHFGGSGTANVFMRRDFYAGVMLLFVVGLPASRAIAGIVVSVIGCLVSPRVLLGRFRGVVRWGGRGSERDDQGARGAPGAAGTRP